jgi:predicted transcriptional regulator
MGEVTRKRGSPKRRTTVTTTARMPLELHAALSEAADEWHLTINYVVNRAVREFLEAHGWIEEKKGA